MNQSDAHAMLDQLFFQAHLQFGNAVKGRWFYDDPRCPGCQRKVSKMRYKGKDAISLNAYIYRKRGILIGYMLCNRCANMVQRAAERNPGVQLGLHRGIEDTLGQAYEQHLNSMDA